MSLAGRYADLIVSRPALVVVVVTVLTGAVVAGVALGDMGGEASVGAVESDSAEAEALDRIDERFETDDGTVAQVVVQGENTLSRESLIATLELQRVIRANETVEPTLQDEQTAGLANLVAAEAIQQAADGPPDDAAEDGETVPPEPTLDDQIEQLESMSDEEVEEVVAALVDPDREGSGDPYTFLPGDYEEGETTAASRTLFVFQQELDDNVIEESQVAIDSIVTGLIDGGGSERTATDDLDRAFVFGFGIVNAENAEALGDTFTLLLPIAFFLVVTVFTLAYRDPVDILLGVLGIAAVLGWMAGVMGWLGLDTSQLLIAVPFLLIGLAIDYSLHVFMRYREARAAGADGPTTGMLVGLTGVIGALAAATISTGVGFFSNIVSPIPAIQDFAIIAAAGIGATLIVFGSLIPALKVLVDRGLERIGAGLAGRLPATLRGRPTTQMSSWLHRLVFKRDKRAIGTGGGVVGRALTGVVGLSRRAPAVILVLALLLAAGGGLAATDIDTEFNEQDFLPEEPPAFTQELPEPFATGDYQVRQNAEFVGDQFDPPGDGGSVQILIEPDGDDDAMTDPETLRAIDRAKDTATQKESVVVRADDTASAESPLTVMAALRTTDEDLDALLTASGADEGGVPDRNVTAVYDAMYNADADEAAAFVARQDSDYTALRLTIGISGDASAQAAADDGAAIAAEIDDLDGVSATATGDQVLNGIVQDELLETLVQAFVITVVVILTFLTVLYWYKYRAPDVGAITLAPVVCALAWLLGAMWYLDIPFNSETAVITSLAIGLGVDYSIHLTERIVEECAHSSLEEGLRNAIQGTGGALLGSASTTAAGFAVLAFALVPPLQRFGTVTGLSIVFAYLACLTILPGLVVVRSRLLGVPGRTAEPADDSDAGSVTASATVTPDGATATHHSDDEPTTTQHEDDEPTATQHEDDTPSIDSPPDSRE